MNTQEIRAILANDPFVGPVFQGVYAIDQLSALQLGAYVVNTSASNKNTGHWVAMWVTPYAVEYFDSYGRDPPEKIKRKCRTKQWICNGRFLQSPLSSVCGQYCIYYLLHRARGDGLEKIVKEFDHDVDENDMLVYEFIKEQYDMHKMKYLDTTGIIQQLKEHQNP